MRARFRPAIAPLLCLLVLSSAAQLVFAAQGEIPVQYADAEIATVLEQLGSALDLRILFDPDLPQGRVTITAEQPVSRGLALELLRAALLSSGYALVPAPGGAHKLLAIEAARGAAPWIHADAVARGERLITAALSLDHVDPVDLMTDLAPLTGSRALVIPHRPTRSLIIATTELRFQRLLEIIRALDQAASRDLRVLPLRYASVQETRDQVSEAFPTDGLDGELLLLADDRTQSLIVEASPHTMQRIERLVGVLDIPRQTAGALNVIRVRNVDAETLAENLSALRGSESDGPIAGTDYEVIADPPTNSLVIRASPSVFRTLADLVAELDEIPPLIELDFLVLEAGTDLGRDLAFDAILPLFRITPTGENLGFVTRGELLSLIGPVELLPGFVGRVTRAPLLITVIGPTGTPLTLAVPAGGASITAEDSEVTFRELMRPMLLATSGEEHRLFSGETVPIPVSGSDPAGASPFITSTSIERHEVGIELLVTPRALPGGIVELELQASLDSVTAGPVVPAFDFGLLGIDPNTIPGFDPNDLELFLPDQGPILRQVELETRVRLRDGVVAVVASAPRPQIERVESRVPFLSDIPFLGQFFRNQSHTTRERTFILAVRASLRGSPAEERAEQLSQRRALARERDRTIELGDSSSRYALRVASVKSRERAEALAAELGALPGRVRIREWGAGNWDVYLYDLRDWWQLGAQITALRKRGLEPRLALGPPPDSGS